MMTVGPWMRSKRRYRFQLGRSANQVWAMFFDLVHLRSRPLRRSFAGEISGISFAARQGRAFDSFRLNRLPVAAGRVQGRVSGSQDGCLRCASLSELSRAKPCQSRPRATPSCLRARRSPAARRCGWAQALLAGKRDVEPRWSRRTESSTARCWRLAEGGGIIFVASKIDWPLDFSTPRRPRRFVEPSRTLRTQRRCQHRQRGLALRFCQVAHTHLAFENSCGEIRPALALRLVFESKDDLATLGVVKGGEEFLRGGDDTGGRRARWRVRLGKAVQRSAE